MKDKYREIMEELLYYISRDIYNLLDEEDIVEAITNLSNKVESLSDYMWEDEIVYESSESDKVKYSLR